MFMRQLTSSADTYDILCLSGNNQPVCNILDTCFNALDIKFKVTGSTPPFLNIVNYTFHDPNSSKTRKLRVFDFGIKPFDLAQQKDNDELVQILTSLPELLNDPTINIKKVIFETYTRSYQFAKSHPFCPFYNTEAHINNKVQRMASLISQYCNPADVWGFIYVENGNANGKIALEAIKHMLLQNKFLADQVVHDSIAQTQVDSFRKFFTGLNEPDIKDTNTLKA